MGKERIHYIDVAKGLAILIVVLGHCAATTIGDHSRLFYTIYAFHMPFWFFLSGMLYNSKDWQSFFSGKVKALLLPYLFFFILNIFSYQVLNYTDHLQLFQFVRFGGLWFLLALFYVVISYYVLDTYCFKKFQGISRKVVLTILAFSFLIVGVEGGGKDLPISALSTAMVCFFFFHLGVLVREFKGNLNYQTKRDRTIVLGLSLIQIFILAYTAPINPVPVDVNYGRYGNKVLFLVQALLGILGFLLLAAALKKNNNIEYLGRNSLLILVLHIPLWHVFDTLFSLVGLFGYIRLLFVFICVSILTLLVLIPINKFIPELKGDFNFDKK